MKSVFDTRRGNLRKLMEQWGGPTSLSVKLGHSNGSYLAQLAGPHPSRDVSEKVAREIERKLGLSPMWLDQQHKTAPGQPDTNLLIEVVALVQDLLQGSNVKLSKEKFTEVVNLVYERAAETNTNQQAYARRLINLLK
jgi:hypothetical protein